VVLTAPTNWIHAHTFLHNNSLVAYSTHPLEHLKPGMHFGLAAAQPMYLSLQHSMQPCWQQCLLPHSTSWDTFVCIHNSVACMFLAWGDRF
jgi:hypothetical protein